MVAIVKFLFLAVISQAIAYPSHWWAPVSREGAPTWEVFPDEALAGEVILSKRNELGILSNFAATPFVFHGKSYASMEGFWQSLKYPEAENDERFAFGIFWPHTRSEVAAMTAFAAKKAGDVGSENMKALNIDWVTFENTKMVYKESGDSAFYKLIVAAMWAKVDQNPQVRTVLLQTGNLILRPDHRDADASTVKAWRYYDIWMDIRTQLHKP